MNSILVLVVGIGILIAGYVFYGKWLAEQWGVDPKRKTPAFTERTVWTTFLPKLLS